MNPLGPPDGGPIGGVPGGSGCDGCVDIGGKEKGPRPPEIEIASRPRPQIIHKTQLDPGMLLRRVEPAYPALARQIHREGRVELRALIGTHPNIPSLQLVPGAPLFVPPP